MLQQMNYRLGKSIMSIKLEKGYQYLLYKCEGAASDSGDMHASLLAELY
jgi:hypothetical protein